MTEHHRENHEPSSIRRKRARGDEKVSSCDSEGNNRRKRRRSRSPAAMSSSSKREASDLRSEILKKQRGKEKINWESIRDSRSRSRSRYTGSSGRSFKNDHRRSESKDTSQIDKGWHGSQHLRMDEESRSRDKGTTLDNLRGEPCSLAIVKKEDALCDQEEVKSTEVQVKEENLINHDEMKLREIKGRNCLVSPTQQVKEEVQGNVASLKKVILIMVLVFEEKEKAVKLMVNPLKPVEKAIQEMAKHLKKDPQSLLFCLEQGGGKLTGKEMMGDLEGARIVVTRLS